MAATTETIWADFHEELLRFLRRRVRDPDVAQDLLQDVFVKIHLHLPTLAHADRLAGWVYQIARNTVLDHFRQQRPAPEPIDAPAPAVAAWEEPTPGLDFACCLGAFLNRLPPEYRHALQLTELGPLSQKDYAAQVGISYSGAKSRVQRARRHLHGLFAACCHLTADVYGNTVTARPRAAAGCAALG